MSSYSATLLPAGFHPVLSVQLHSNSNDDASSSTDACPIYLHLSLPPSFIADRFQLAQLHSEGRLGAPSLDNVSHSFSATGERNLEWPVALANRSEVVIRLREGNGKGKGKEEQWDIPLHLRYQVPILERWSRGARRDKVEVDLEWPTLYSVCEPGQSKGQSQHALTRFYLAHESPCSSSSRTHGLRCCIAASFAPPPQLFHRLLLPAAWHTLQRCVPALSTSHPRSHCAHRRRGGPPHRRNRQLCRRVARHAVGRLVGLQGTKAVGIAAQRSSYEEERMKDGDYQNPTKVAKGGVTAREPGLRMRGRKR